MKFQKYLLKIQHLKHFFFILKTIKFNSPFKLPSLHHLTYHLFFLTQEHVKLFHSFQPLFSRSSFLAYSFMLGYRKKSKTLPIFISFVCVMELLLTVLYDKKVRGKLLFFIKTNLPLFRHPQQQLSRILKESSVDCLKQLSSL